MNEQIARLVDRLRQDRSPQASLVLADALLEQGDPRGELIRLQLAREDGGNPCARETEVVGQHLAMLAGFQPGEHVQLDWHRGFVHAVTVPSRAAAASRHAAMVAVATLPEAGLVRRLVLEEPPPARGYGNPTNLLHALFEELLAKGLVFPASLDALHLGNGLATNPYHWEYRDFEGCAADENLAPLWRLFPCLRELTLDLGHAVLRLGEVDTEHLRVFEWVAPWLDEEALGQILRMRTPNLECLVLWTGQARMVNEAEEVGEPGFDDLPGEGLVRYKQLQPLLEHLGTLPHLHTFGLVNFAGSWGSLSGHFGDHSGLHRIETLNISRGRLDDADVEGFSARCKAMPRLKRVVAEDLFITETGWVSLREALGPIALEGWQSWAPSRFSFVSVME